MEARASIVLELLDRLDVTLVWILIDDELGVDWHVGDSVATAEQLHGIGNFCNFRPIFTRARVHLPAGFCGT